MKFLPRAIWLTLQSVQMKKGCCVSVSIELLNSSNIFCPSIEGIMCPKANLNTHLCSEGGKHQKAENLCLLSSLPAPIRSGRFSLFVGNVVSTPHISVNKEKVSISSKVLKQAADAIACDFSIIRLFITPIAFSTASSLTKTCSTMGSKSQGSFLATKKESEAPASFLPCFL
jgi:hypothetical protein